MDTTAVGKHNSVLFKLACAIGSLLHSPVCSYGSQLEFHFSLTDYSTELGTNNLFLCQAYRSAQKNTRQFIS